jgi:hypothetical protein
MSRALALITLAGVVHGCASAGKSPVASMPPPSSPTEARQQMEQLERMIRDNRVALGLPASRSGEVTATGEDAETGEQVQAGAKHVEPAVRPALPSPPPAMAPPEPPARMAESVSSGGRSEPTCAPGCRHTRAICEAAERICGLARYLGEDDAFRRCEQARRDCRDARHATAGRDCDDCG